MSVSGWTSSITKGQRRLGTNTRRRNKKLPPTINYESLNEHINLDRSPFYINTECKDWTVVGAEPRRAAINGFGFSSTNAHMVIKEYVNQADQRQAIPTDVAPAQPYPILVSAKNEQRLLDYRADAIAEPAMP